MAEDGFAFGYVIEEVEGEGEFVLVALDNGREEDGELFSCAH